MKKIEHWLLITWMVITAPTFAQEQEAKQINFISQIGCEVQFDLDYILTILVNSEEISDSLFKIDGDKTLDSLKADDERLFISPDYGLTIISFTIDENYTIASLVMRDDFVWYYCEEEENLCVDPFLYFVGDDGSIYRFFIFEFNPNSLHNSVCYRTDGSILIDDTFNGRSLELFEDEDGSFRGKLSYPTYPTEKVIFHLLDEDRQNQILLNYLFNGFDDVD